MMKPPMLLGALLGVAVAVLGVATAPSIATASARYVEADALKAPDCGGLCQQCGTYKTKLITWSGPYWHQPYSCAQISCPNECNPQLTSGDTLSL